MKISDYKAILKSTIGIAIFSAFLTSVSPMTKASSPIVDPEELEETIDKSIVRMAASEEEIKFKDKGGAKVVDIYCNSDEKYVENHDLNWYVEMCPSWIELTIGGISKGKKVNMGALGPGMVKTPVTVRVNATEPGTQQYMYGRTSRVILRSGDATVEFRVSQERKK